MLPNVICVSGPFTTLKLVSTLKEADNLAAMIHNPDPAKKLVLLGKTSPVHLTQDELAAHRIPLEELCSSPDEGYASIDDSPPLSSLNEQLGQTHEHSGESGLDWGLSAVHQSDDLAFWKHPITPSRPVKSARPLTLVVDDNSVNLRILQMYCKKRGLLYLSAANGKQAVEIFANQQALYTLGDDIPIELILMDFQMPVCDGIDATKQVRSLENYRGWNSSILLIVTGQDSQMDREAASAAGANDYLVKPVGMRILDSYLSKYFPALEN